MTKARENSDYTGLAADIAAGDTAARAGRKNMLLNGDYTVWQRSASATALTTDIYSSVDRWKTRVTDTSEFTVSKSSESPSGFASSCKWDCTTANASPSSGVSIIHEQRMEGQNLQHLQYGLATAKSVTASFWVRGTVTGVYTVGLYSPDGNRHIESSYTIGSANTWEHKTITFAGDTGGTLNNDTGEGMRLWFWLGGGSGFSSGTHATSWAAYSQANVLADSQVNLASSTSNDWYIAGVQLEVGSGTDFEHRSYGEILADCQRYFERFDYSGGGRSGLTGECHSTSIMYGGFHFQPKRATPSISTSTVSNFRILHAGSGTNVTGLAFNANTMCARVGVSTGGGLTAGRAGCMDSDNDNGQYIDIDAEL
mgnify:CR=1 FL=1